MRSQRLLIGRTMTECNEMYERTSSPLPVLECRGRLSALLLDGLSVLFTDSLKPHIELLVPRKRFVFIIPLHLYLILLFLRNTRFHLLTF